MSIAWRQASASSKSSKSNMLPSLPRFACCKDGLATRFTGKLEGYRNQNGEACVTIDTLQPERRGWLPEAELWAFRGEGRCFHSISKAHAVQGVCGLRFHCRLQVCVRLIRLVLADTMHQGCVRVAATDTRS